MAELLFGTGGTPHSARTPATIDGIERIAELGLGCMEIEFVQGVRMSEATARLVAETAERTGIKLSVHAPYFINLNAREPEKITASQGRLLRAARIGAICGAESIVFHAAFYLGEPPQKTYETTKKHLSEILSQLKDEGRQVWLRPEITGKGSQFGTLDELLRLSQELEGVAPCIDFAHWHARTGKFNTYGEFAKMLQQIKGQLGNKALSNMHIHLAGISYGKKGELKHLNLKESDLQYAEVLQALKDNNASGLVICESPNLEEDALLLQSTYNALSKKD